MLNETQLGNQLVNNQPLRFFSVKLTMWDLLLLMENEAILNLLHQK